MAHATRIKHDPSDAYQTPVALWITFAIIADYRMDPEIVRARLADAIARGDSRYIELHHKPWGPCALYTISMPANSHDPAEDIEAARQVLEEMETQVKDALRLHDALSWLNFGHD